MRDAEWSCGPSVRRGALTRIFPWSATILDDAAVVCILSCDFERTCSKYGARGYRYVLLEAGHAAQNAGLWCEEHGLGIVEVGGFLDEELARLIGVTYPDVAPLLALVVGR
jgi:SagB-type dehydrogenase family enzyme